MNPELEKSLQVTTLPAVLKNLGIIETRVNDKNVLFRFASPRGKPMLGDTLSGQDDHQNA